jgi:NAD(P)-dependent dehydrogenase (short-subunit alcohol dehydrogenase family)
MKTWFITGCSSGFGKELVLNLLARGEHVVATVRRSETLEQFNALEHHNLLTLLLDVTDPASIDCAVSQAVAKWHCIDVLINNAGVGLRAAVEESDDSEIHQIFDVNFFGAHRVTRAVLPHMRRERSGDIVMISSIGGRVSRPGSGFYSATKFALEGMSDALRKEVAPLGIRVMLVEPSAFRTDFELGLNESKTTIADYADTAGLRRRSHSNIHRTQHGDPAVAAETIINTVLSDDPPFRLLLGKSAVERAERELQEQLDELVKWRSVSIAADGSYGQL